MVSCSYFAMCTNAADGTVSHPILGAVATCERCADRVGIVLEPETPHRDIATHWTLLREHGGDL